MHGAAQGRRTDLDAEAPPEMCRQEDDGPAGLQVAEVGRRLTGLGLGDRHQMLLARRPATAGGIIQTRQPLGLIYGQPGAHGGRIVTQQRADLRRRVPLIGKQHKVAALAHPPKCLARRLAEFVPLFVRQRDMEHGRHLTAQESDAILAANAQLVKC